MNLSDQGQVGDFVRLDCGGCGEPFAMTAARYHKARNDHKQVGFFCPNGCCRVFKQGPSAETLLRQERDRLKQDAARLEDEVRKANERTEKEREKREAADRRTSAAKGQVTKIKNRVAAGVCPCCNRTFQNVARHMASQHPELVSEGAE